MTQSLHWLLNKLLTPQALSFFYIPLGVLLLTHFINLRSKSRPSSATDLFAFVLALDMTLIANDQLRTRVNPLFQPYFIQIFMVGWIASAILLANSIHVQSLVGTSGRKGKYYPAEKVALCWFFAFVMMSFHLFAILGG
jgi:hypothetical protein